MSQVTMNGTEWARCAEIAGKMIYELTGQRVTALEYTVILAMMLSEHTATDKHRELLREVFEKARDIADGMFQEHALKQN